MDIDRKALFELFLAEAEEGLAAMEHALLELEQRSDDRTIIDAIFRASHTLKGNAASLGFTSLSKFAHSIEGLLDRVRHGELQPDAGMVSLLLSAGDMLKEWLPALDPEADPPMTPAQQELAEQIAGFECRTRTLAGPPSAPSPAQGQARVPVLHSSANTIRIAAERMDALVDLAAELAISFEHVHDKAARLPLEVREQVAGILEEPDRLVHDLNAVVMRCRMVPLGPTFRRHLRTVRDLARAHDKDVCLVLEGEDVEVDMSVIEQLADPLVHMIRNALDHGIESAAERVASGKPRTATILLRGWQQHGSIFIELKDDGRGISRQKVRARAEQLGIPPQSLSDSELLQLIFRPGFSTADKVTEVSGRGVGMDVVRRNIERVRGSISLHSVEGEGTAVTLRLPLTLAVIPGFVVGVADEQFVVPMQSVRECIELAETPAAERDGAGFISVRGEPVPYVRLRDFFHFDAAPSERQMMVLIDHRGGAAGLVVDELFGEAATVIKPLGSLLRALPGVAGTAITGSGRVALVLETTSIFRELEAGLPEVA